jgi:tetratricopeptide (TPR) repeat protein
MAARALGCALIALALASPVAHGAPRSPGTDQKRALHLFQESEAKYRLGHFREAAEILKQAYEAYPEPILLYNLARALESDGDLEGATQAYSQYLDVEKKAIDRGAIERRIATIKGQIAERQRLARERETADQARIEAESRLKQVPAPKPRNRFNRKARATRLAPTSRSRSAARSPWPASSGGSSISNDARARVMRSASASRPRCWCSAASCLEMIV